MSDQPLMLAWNFPNWITVILMALAGYALLLALATMTGRAGMGAGPPTDA